MIFQSSIVEAIGWTLIHSLWQITLIGLLVKLFLSIYKDRISAVKYNISLFGMSSIFVATISTFLRYSLESFSTKAEGGNNILINSQVTNPIISQSAEASNLALNLDIVTGFLQNNINTIVLIWLIGVLVFSIRLTGSYWYIQRLKRKLSNPLQQQWKELVTKISRSLDVNRKIEILESHLTKIPIVIGHLKPAIILPIGLVTSLPFNQLEAILAHELAHIKRNDFLTNLCCSFLETIFFYHPAFWWISKTLNLEREHCCDDITINYCGTDKHLQSALIDLHKHNIKPNQLAAALYKNEYQLLKRIKRMKTKNLPKESLRKTNHEKKGNLAGTVVLLVGILIFALGSAFSHRTSDLPDQLPGIQKPVEHVGIIPEPMAPKNVPALNSVPETTFTENIPALNSEHEPKVTEIVPVLISELKPMESISIPSVRVPDSTKTTISKKTEAEIEVIENELKEAEKEMKEAQKALQEVSTNYYEKLFELQKENGQESWSLFEKEYAEAQAMAEFQLQESNLELLHFNDLFFDSISDQFDNSFDLFEENFRLQELQQDILQDQLWESIEHIHELEGLQELELEELEELEMQSLKLETSFKKELLKDGIIEDMDDKISIQLSNKTFEVNGEKQSNKIHEKYLKLYEDIFNNKLEGNTRMIIDDTY